MAPIPRVSLYTDQETGGEVRLDEGGYTPMTTSTQAYPPTEIDKVPH